MFGKEFDQKNLSLGDQLLKNLKDNSTFENFEDEKELRKTLKRKLEEGKLF
ncbi:MAG: hypothetical protein WCF28_04640 [Methanobacterium sp.]|uniref:hypothetical protein n=1 Tax=Methanobacterium sp. TaxID=2164 RepID=UPI003C786DA8